jgi:hypothetical protein
VTRQAPSPASSDATATKNYSVVPSDHSST